MNKLDKRDMPISIIILSLILFFPLGIYFIVLKTDKYLINIKKTACLLNIFGYTSLTILILYFIIHYSYYVSLIDSHMSLDMYNFSFAYFYIFFLMITISCLIGGKKLNNECNKLIIYTEFINVRHIRDIGLISEETLEDIGTVKNTINKLIDTGHLVNVKLENNNIISTKTVDKNSKDVLVKCKSCGNIEILKDNKAHCSFCYRLFDEKK